MPEEASFTIEGLEETIAMLDRAPKSIVAHGFLKALQSAADVFSQGLEISTPVSSSKLWNDETFSEFVNQTGGDLKSALKVTIELDSNFRGGNAGVGYGKQTHIAFFVEYGHRAVTHKPNKRVVGFVPAHPFIRPVFDALKEQAVAAFHASLIETLDQNPEINTTKAA